MKKIIITSILLVVVLVSGIFYFSNKVVDEGGIAGTPTPTIVEESPSPSSSPSPQAGQGATRSPSPVYRLVPWELLLSDASCELQGEIKFLNLNTYDHQDAKFIYVGVDDVARNIFWTVTPEDNLAVGPNLFVNGASLPNGESLLSITLPAEPKYKTYELTAKIQYGRLVDENGKFVSAGGHVEVFEKQCQGKTTVVLP